MWRVSLNRFMSLIKEGEREGGREGGRERERERERQRERQRDRETERQRDRDRETETERERERSTLELTSLCFLLQVHGQSPHPSLPFKYGQNEPIVPSVALSSKSYHQ